MANQHKLFVNRKLRAARKEYFENKFKAHATNCRKTWKLLNSLMCRGKSFKDIVLNVDGDDCHNNAVISNKFNDYFISIADNINSALPISNNSPLNYMGRRVPESFFCLPASEEEISRVIASFENKGCNINKIPVYIYKHVLPVISPVIADLFNCSIAEGRFSDCLKEGTVVPLHKAGDRKQCNNYRPITTLPILSKIFEKLMYNRMISFIDKHKIIVPFQYGFRSNSNTSDALLEFTNDIYSSIDLGKISCSVFLDFQKAFDCVDINILLTKLEHLGFRGINFKWLESFLKNRYQRVCVGNAISHKALVTRGVPQGSTLGPLLFLLFINDMHSCDNQLRYIHFADDTTVTCCGDNFTDIKQNMEAGLVNINKWLLTNRLSLNVNKSLFMVFTNKSVPHDFAIQLSNQNITYVEHTKFLGIVIDNRLKYSDHVDFIAGKLSRTIGIIRRASHNINLNL